MTHAGEQGVDLLPPPDGGVHIATQQVDLGAGLVRHPVEAVRRASGQRVDQCRGLGRAPTGEQRFGCVPSQEAGQERSVQAGLPGVVNALQRHLGRVSEPGELEVRIACGNGQFRQSQAVFCGPGEGQCPLKERKPLIGQPAPERVFSEAAYDKGNHGRGADLFSDLQCPFQRGGDALMPSLDGAQEVFGVVEPGPGLVG